MSTELVDVWEILGLEVEPEEKKVVEKPAVAVKQVVVPLVEKVSKFVDIVYKIKDSYKVVSGMFGHFSCTSETIDEIRAEYTDKEEADEVIRQTIRKHAKAVTEQKRKDLEIATQAEIDANVIANEIISSIKLAINSEIKAKKLESKVVKEKKPTAVKKEVPKETPEEKEEKKLQREVEKEDKFVKKQEDKIKKLNSSPNDAKLKYSYSMLTGKPIELTYDEKLQWVSNFISVYELSKLQKKSIECVAKEFIKKKDVVYKTENPFSALNNTSLKSLINKSETTSSVSDGISLKSLMNKSKTETKTLSFEETIAAIDANAQKIAEDREKLAKDLETESPEEREKRLQLEDDKLLAQFELEMTTDLKPKTISTQLIIKKDKDEWEHYLTREYALKTIHNAISVEYGELVERQSYKSIEAARSNVAKIFNEIAKWTEEVNKIKVDDAKLSNDINLLLEIIAQRPYSIKNSSVLYTLYMHKSDEILLKEDVEKLRDMLEDEEDEEDEIQDDIYNDNEVLRGSKEGPILKAGYEFIIHIDTNCVDEYVGFKTVDARDNFIKRTEITDECMHEKINLLLPFNPFLELDCKCKEEEKPKVAKRILNIIKEYEKRLGSEAVYVLGNPKRFGKLSAHVFPKDKNILVANNKELLEFINDIKENLDEISASYIDTDFTTSKAHYLRLPYFVKYDRYSDTSKIEYSHLTPKEKMTRDSWAVQHTDGKWRHYNNLDKSEFKSNLCESDVILFEPFIKELVAKYPCYKSDPRIRKNFIRLSRAYPSECKAENCKKFHEKRGCNIWRYGNTIFAKCDNTNGQVVDGKKVGLLHKAQISDTTAVTANNRLAQSLNHNKETKIPVFDDLDTITNDFTIINTKRISETVINDGSDLMIKSAYGSGKSYAIGIWSKDWITTNKSVLYVCCRRTLVSQVVKDTGFENYQNIVNRVIHAEDHPRLVIQIDSLHRIEFDYLSNLCNTGYDVIIIDEVTQMLSQCYDMKNTNYNAQISMSQLRGYVEKCGQLIMLDNDLSSSQINIFMKLRPERKCKTYVNKMSAWSHIKPKICIGANAANLVRMALYDKIKEQSDLRDANSEYSRIVVACHAKAQVDKLVKYIEKTYSDKKDMVSAYTSDTDDIIKQTHFSDTAKFWHKSLVVIYSPTVSVGVSCSNIPDLAGFKYCFGFFDNNCIPTSTNVQMLTRCRNITEITISLNMPPSYGIPTTIPKLLKYACCSHNSKIIPNYLRHDRTPGINEPTALDADAFTSKFGNTFEAQCWLLSIINIFRSRSWPAQRLIKIMTDAGFQTPIIMDRDDVAEIKQIDIKNFIEIGKEVRAEVAKSMLTNLDKGAELLAQNDSSLYKTKAEKLGIEGVITASVFKVSKNFIKDEKWFEQYLPHVKKERNRVESVTRHENTEVQLQLSVTSSREANKLTEDVFKVLGISSNENGETIYKNKFKNVVEDISVYRSNPELWRKNHPKVELTKSTTKGGIVTREPNMKERTFPAVVAIEVDHIHALFVKDINLLSEMTTKQLNIVAANAKRVYDYGTQHREVKDLKSRVAIANIALNHFGCGLISHKSEDSKYILVWDKYEYKTLIEPVPKHVISCYRDVKNTEDIITTEEPTNIEEFNLMELLS